MLGKHEYLYGPECVKFCAMMMICSGDPITGDKKWWGTAARPLLILNIKTRLAISHLS